MLENSLFMRRHDLGEFLVLEIVLLAPESGVINPVSPSL